MARTRKSIQALNLYKYDVLIEDKATRSDYFKVTQFDGNFYGGRNSFLVAGANVLKQNSKILVEILNKDGTTVYSAPVTSFIEGNSRLIQIEVYNDTPIGAGKLVLLGCAETYLDGTPIPTDWQGKYNVRWITDVIISPLIENKTPIRFEKAPSAIATEKFYFAPSSSLFVEQIKVPVDIELTQKFYNVFPNGYLVKLRGPGEYESEYLDGFITGTIAFSNSTTSETASVRIPITKIYNSTLAESQGALIYTKNKTLVSEGFLSGSGIYTTNISPYGQVLVSSSINIEYNKLTTLDVGLNISFAKLRIVDLKTISGEIHKVRLAYKPSTEPGEFVALGDINTTVAELLTIDSGSKIVETGQFTDVKISDYWYSETMSLQKNASRPVLPLYYISSSLSSSYLPIIQSSNRLLGAISATPQIVNSSYINNVSYFIGTKNTNTVQLFPRVEYTLKFDAIVGKTSASVALNQGDYSLEVYLVKEAGVEGKLLETDVRGQLLGTLTPKSTFQRQNFEGSEFNFTPKIITTGNFGLRFVAYGGFWDVANVSIKPAQEPLFSPDEIDVLIPNVNYTNSVLTFKVDYLDVNNNSINISTFSTPTYFTGSYSTIAPSGNASVSIGVTPPPAPAVGDLWWNSEEGQLKIYYFDGDSYQWVDASGESIETGSFSPSTISSSYALTASYALNGGGGGSSVSSSYPFSVSGSTLYTTYDVTPSNFATDNSIFIGNNAGSDSKGGSYDSSYAVFIGTEAGRSTGNGWQSVLIGPYTGYSSSAYESIMIGAAAGYEAMSPYSILIGVSAGAFATTASSMTAIGGDAGKYSTNIQNTTLLGFGAGYSADYIENSTIIGGADNSAQLSYVTTLGFAASNLVSASYSNFIGLDAGDTAQNVMNSNFIGAYSGQSANGIYYSTAIGERALEQADNISYVTAIGSSAGVGVKGFATTYVGTYAGAYSQRISHSLFMGGNAGFDQASASYSTFIGFKAGAAGYHDIGGYSTTFGAGNLLGPNNIIIGTNLTLPTNRRDSINIGGIIFGTGSYANTGSTTTPFAGTSNGRIGINVVTPLYELHVSGAGHFSHGITGSLFGTASYSQNSVVFPFTGSAIISGSLRNTGSLSVSGSTTLFNTLTINHNPQLNFVGNTAFLRYSTGDFRLGTDTGGGIISFMTNGTTAWYIDTSQRLLPNFGNTMDIGLTGQRVKTIFTTHISSSNPIASASYAASATLTSASNALTTSVSSSLSNTYLLGPSVSLTAGTWLVTSTVTVTQNNSGTATYYGKIASAGGTDYASTQVTSAGIVSSSVCIGMSAIVVRTTTDTIGTYVASDSGSIGIPYVIRHQQTNNASGNTASTITATKIG